MTLVPDTAESLTFLRALYPEGPWVLTAITPDHPRDKPGATETRTFLPQGERHAAEWIANANGAGRNVYYHVNRPRRQLTKKADREDLAAVHYLHVDVDPRAREDLAQEHARIEALLRDPPGGVPRPTFLVASGGGYNALWRLREPIELGGDLAKAEEAKLYNLALERELGGDNCHNVDRILRLPGTVNWPDAKKRKKGRVPAIARLVATEDVTYDLTQFRKAVQVQAPTGTGFSGTSSTTRAQVSGNVRRLETVDDLPPSVAPKTKELIVTGEDADDPTRFSSRSEILYHVCCQLVRDGVDDETIYAVITDPGWKIAASVLDKGTKADAYARRQIERARENAINPYLRELNDRFAVIGNMGGKCRVVELVKDHATDPPRERLTKQSFEDFRNRFSHIKVDLGENAKGEAVKMPLGAWWLAQETRRQYDYLVFAPGREVPNAYNLWTGFGVEAVAGDRHESFLAHLRDNLCAGNDDHYRYLVAWLARMIQRPAETGEVAIVLRGRQGTGKGIFARMVGRLLGRHYVPISNATHLVGQFNGHLRDCVCLFADEAFFAGDKRHESILKSIITEESMMMELKGVDAEVWPNYVHLIMASNEKWVVPANADERRFLVLDVAATRMQDAGYFGRILTDMEREGGLQNLLRYLLDYDLSGYNHRDVPKTKALQEQKQLSLTSEQEWWYRKLEEGVLLRDHLRWEADVLKDNLLDDYLTYAARVGVGRRSTATSLGRFLTQVAPGLRGLQKVVTMTDEAGRPIRRRAYFYQFPDLATCRRHWDEHHGGPYEWTTHEAPDDDRHPNEPF